MLAPSRARAILLALLLLAPSLLCLADPDGLSAPRVPSRIGAAEGIRCFCHPGAQEGAASLSKADGPVARLLYAATVVHALEPGSPPAIFAHRDIPAAGLISLEPPTPPPIVSA